MKRWKDDRPGMTILFFRNGGFYPTYYPINYTNWQAEADRNPGTIKITDATGERILWQLNKETK